MARGVVVLLLQLRISSFLGEAAPMATWLFTTVGRYSGDKRVLFVDLPWVVHIG
jgi:hypothetical protein